MSDGEPEPFTMSTEPDDEDSGPGEPEAADPDPGDAAAADEVDSDEGELPGDTESIADLIDEASRTAAEQAEREATGEVPPDRSADVWGDDRDTGGSDVEAVWAAAEKASSSHGLWVEDDHDTDAWAEQEQETPFVPPPAPDADEDPRTSPHRGPPAGAEGMDHLPSDDEGPETFTFAVGEDDTGEEEAAAAPTPQPRPDDEEPEPFRFGAGPGTSAPMPVEDTPAGDDAEEPEAFAFPVTDATSPSSPTSTDGPGERIAGDDTVATPPTDEAPSEEPVQEWPVPSDAAADGDQDPDHDVWTFDVTTDAADSAESDDPDAPLAESAHPRSDAGWHDLDAEEEPGWSVPDLPLRTREDEEEEPTGFAASLDDDDDDAPWTSGPADDDDDDDAPWTSGPAEDDTASEGVGMPADVVTAEVHDALGELLGTGDGDTSDGGSDGPTAAPAPTDDAAPAPTGDAAPVPSDDAAPVPADDAPTGDPLDELADLDLDQFDDLDAVAATADAPAEDGQESPDATDAHDEDDADDEAAPGEGPLDAPTAAREVMQPGSVSFSSGGKKKKRGFFG